MEKNEATNEILNDLLKINNDRIEGYEKAISEAKSMDIDIKAMFEEMVKQSADYKNELVSEIEKNDGIVEDETTASGKIYRAWMDIKATMEDSDRHSIIASCEFGEDAAQRAYDAALSSQAITDPAILELINQQQAGLKKSHEMIKIQRDAHEALLK